jgi:hypothetical protein
MTVAVIDPLVGRLRRRRSLVHSDITESGRRPEPVVRLIDSLDQTLDSLLSLDPDAQLVGRALWLQHEALHQHAATLDTLLGEMMRAEAVDPLQRTSACVLLSDFARELDDHLSFEEQNGCLERAAEAEPRFADRIAGLVEEHECFRSQVVDLTVSAHDAGSARTDWNPLRRGFHELCEALRVHESAEADVVYKADLLELGGSG